MGVEHGNRSNRARMAVIVTAAGMILGVSSVPLLAWRAAQAQARPETGPPRSAAAAQTAPTSRDGARFFADRDAGPAKVACADCHLIGNPALPPPDDLIRSGHSLFDAFGRGSWWNGRITTDCGEAAEVCLKRFQGGEALDPNMRTALVLYMKSQSAPVSSPMILMRVPAGRAEVNQGNAARGRDLFRRACVLCHVPGRSESVPDLTASNMTPREIADVIRTGKGRMPFFQGDILGDEQVADIAVHTYSLQPRTE